MVTLTDLGADRLSSFADFDGHERIVHIRDEQTGLNGFIGIHNRNLGPALGGCRMRAYASEDEAITDVLRLSRGMTYKNALAGLPLGGGKSVITGDPFKDKTDDMMRAMGRAVEALGGHYITAEDSGTAEHDMVVMAAETSYVVGLPGERTDGLGGNPSPVTAFGVFAGMQSAVRHRLGRDNFAGLRVAVQGLGAVGYDLCRRLHAAGAALTVCDIRPATLDQARADMPGLSVVEPDAIFDVEADIFSPCALGAQLNARTIPRLKAAIVAGAANNQLETPQDGERLAARDILYVPDFVVNAGGVISVGYEYFARSGRNPFKHGLDRAAMEAHVARIDGTTERIFDLARKENITTAQAADRLAESIFRKPARAHSAA